MNYLKYIELAAENLQFYLWFRSYSKRFDQLPATEKVLAPEWIPDYVETETPNRPNSVSPAMTAVFKDTGFASEPKDKDANKETPFTNTPPQTPNSDKKPEGNHSLDSSGDSTVMHVRADHNQRAANAFEGAGLKWKPRKFT